jgi:hypothetical protein
VLVRVGVVSEPAGPALEGPALEGWCIILPEFAVFAIDDGDFALGLLAHVSVCIHAIGQLVSLGALGSKKNKWNLAALSRNARLVPSDIRNATFEWDMCHLASNRSVSPETLMEMRGASGSSFFAALSAHPGLTMSHVRARLGEPWCWYTLSARLVTPGDIDGLPVHYGALVLNSSFSDADLRGLGLERTRMCARHGFSCAPRAGPVGPVGPVGPSSGSSSSSGSIASSASSASLECGLRDVPVNWHVFVRLADTPQTALQEALDAGEEHRAMIVSALGNANLSLPLSAWCLARLRWDGKTKTCLSSLGSSRWSCLTAAGNEMCADRTRHEDAREALRACHASLVRLCVRRRLPISVCRCIYAHAANARVTRVVRRTDSAALVAFECGIRPNRLWLPLADPLCS